jgi:hypothetical protein
MIRKRAWMTGVIFSMPMMIITHCTFYDKIKQEMIAEQATCCC